MEKIPKQKGLQIFIDFAHTPNGLKQALTTLKQQGKGKLFALIGAEGYRDEGKRYLMGEVAAKLADIVIITSVDPRGQIEQINQQILEGTKKAGGILGQNILVENNRQEAIDLAINKLAKKGDRVGIFGKGDRKSTRLNSSHQIISYA